MSGKGYGLGCHDYDSLLYNIEYINHARDYSFGVYYCIINPSITCSSTIPEIVWA